MLNIHHRFGHVLAIVIIVLVAAGCTKSDEPVAQSSASLEELAPTLWVDAAPGGAMSLTETKAAAEVGSEVVVRARIGGRDKPFVDGLALVTVVDPALLSCKELHEDACPKPWDYCCEPKESLVQNSGTIQVVDENGNPLAASLENSHGLAPLDHIVVVGTVAEKAGPSFVVNATQIYKE